MDGLELTIPQAGHLRMSSCWARASLVQANSSGLTSAFTLEGYRSTMVSLPQRTHRCSTALPSARRGRAPGDGPECTTGERRPFLPLRRDAAPARRTLSLTYLRDLSTEIEEDSFV